MTLWKVEKTTWTTSWTMKMTRARIRIVKGGGDEAGVAVGGGMRRFDEDAALARALFETAQDDRIKAVMMETETGGKGRNGVEGRRSTGTVDEQDQGSNQEV